MKPEGEFTFSTSGTGWKNYTGHWINTNLTMADLVDKMRTMWRKVRFDSGQQVHFERAR